MVKEARVGRSDILPVVVCSPFCAPADKNEGRWFGGDDMDSSSVVKFSNIELASTCMASMLEPLSEPGPIDPGNRFMNKLMYFWSRKLLVAVACVNDGGKSASSLAKDDPGTKGEGLGSGVDVEGMKVEAAKNGWVCLSETSWLVFLRNGPRIGSSTDWFWKSSMALSLTRRLEPALSG